MELRAKNSHTINAECAGALSWWRINRLPSPPTIPVARDAHDLSDASKPPRRKLRSQFDPQVRIRGGQFHGSQKNHQHDFDLLFRDFFGLGESFCSHSLLCDFSSMSYS